MDSQPTERQQWDNLVTELDKELIVYGPVRHELGRILYNIKVRLRKHGLDKGRRGRWESILAERRIEKSTARDWVVKYQQAEGIPLDKCFFPGRELGQQFLLKTLGTQSLAALPAAGVRNNLLILVVNGDRGSIGLDGEVTGRGGSIFLVWEKSRCKCRATVRENLNGGGCRRGEARTRSWRLS
jgi:hypothetical protein